MMRLVISLSLALLLPTSVTAAELYPSAPPSALSPRHAFIVGVDNYRWLRNLKNPSSDAEAISGKLKSVGFSVTVSTDQRDAQSTTRNSILDGLDDLGREVKNDGGALFFYFAGHGLSINGETFIIPSDARLTSTDDLLERAIPISRIYKVVREARPSVAVIIVDACRDDPFAGRGPFGPEVTPLPTVKDPPFRTLVGFSTVLGKASDDGIGKNSPFTARLLQFIDTASYPISDALNAVRQTFDGPDVERAPVVIDRLSGTFKMMTTQSDFDLEKKRFDEIDRLGTSLLYQGFLSAYPAGYFERTAQQKYAIVSQQERICATAEALQREVCNTYKIVEPYPQTAMTVTEDTTLSARPDSVSRSAMLEKGEQVVVTGEFENFWQVVRSGGQLGFVPKLAVMDIGGLTASSVITADSDTIHVPEPQLTERARQFAVDAPTGPVTIQTTLPSTTGASKEPAALSASLATAKALTDAGIEASRIHIAPAVRSALGAGASVAVLGASINASVPAVQ